MTHTADRIETTGKDRPPGEKVGVGVYGRPIPASEPTERARHIVLPTLCRVRAVIGGIGRFLITLGLLILLFVGYQLWGTNVIAARAQSDLEDEFEQLQSSYPETTTSSTSPTTTTDPGDSAEPKGPDPEQVDLSAVPVPALGDPLGRLVIERAGVDDMFVVGTGREELAKGPGLYPGTSFPGAAGVSAIAGHRTTFGAPFYDLNEVRALGDPQSSRTDGRGDGIVLETLAGTQTFEVIATRIVQPDETWVAAPINQPIDDSAPQTSNNWATVLRQQWKAWDVDEKIHPGDAYLVLTTCNPRFSAAERLVVLGRVEGNETVEVTFPGGRHNINELPGMDEASSADALSGDPASAPPAFAWGVATLAVGLLWWWAYRRWRHPLAWFAGVVPFLVVLAGFYVYLERLLPSSY